MASLADPRPTPTHQGTPYLTLALPRYADILEKEGAVSTEEGAMRVLHETGTATMAKTGMFINCEDGLRIPW